MTEVKGKRRWVPVVLTLSLAVNLAVVAALSGAAWRHKGEGRERRVASGGAIYMQALPREARRDLYRQLRSTMPPDDDTGDMLAVLRQEPFDHAAAAAVLEEGRTDTLLRQDAASAAWLGHITAMSNQERSAYADRLQELAERRSERKRYKEN